MADYEMIFTYLSYLILLAEGLIGGCCLYLLAKPFLNGTLRAACAGAAYFFAMLALYVIPPRFTNFGAHGLGVFAAFLVMCLIKRGHYVQKAFIALTFLALYWLSVSAADILQDKLYAFALGTAFMAAHENLYFALYLVMWLFLLACLLLFMAVSVRCIVKICKYPYADLSLKELPLLAAPSVVGFLGAECMRYYRSSYIAETGKNSDAYDWLALFYCAASVVAVMAALVLYQSVREQREEKLQSGLFAAQMESIRRHIGQVEGLYQNIRGMRHDMTNHLITLERLYAKNQTQEARAYSAELQAALAEAGDFQIGSGNPITDVILQETQSEAARRKIRFSIDFHYPVNSRINAFDVSVILNNALQNALENAGNCGEPFISVLSYRRKNAYMIEIENSLSAPLATDPDTKLPLTTKAEEGHGFGLPNIRKVAQKYYGDIAIEQGDGRFRLSVLLMVE